MLRQRELKSSVEIRVSESEDTGLLGPEAFLESVSDPSVSEHVLSDSIAVTVVEASSALRELAESVSPASGASHASVNFALDSSDGSPCLLVGAVERSSSVLSVSLGSVDFLVESSSGASEVSSSDVDHGADGLLDVPGESVVASDVVLDTSSVASAVSVLLGVGFLGVSLLVRDLLGSTDLVLSTGPGHVSGLDLAPSLGGEVFASGVSAFGLRSVGSDEDGSDEGGDLGEHVLFYWEFEL
jgi:hypothetical protein